MPTTRRSRTVADVPERVWETVSDPYHLPRWWPKVTRVEGVYERKGGSGSQWTKVFETESGKAIRADFRCRYSRAPEALGWEQEVAGSPFERIMASARTEVALAPDGNGTRVTLVVRQKMRGTARFAGWIVRRGTRHVLDEALRALEELHGA